MKLKLDFLFTDLSQHFGIYLVVVFAPKVFLFMGISKRWHEVICVVKLTVIQPQPKYKNQKLFKFKEKIAQRHYLKTKTNRNFKMLLGQITSTTNTVKFLVCFVFFPNQQRPCYKNIVEDKGLNLFDECAAECVHLCRQEEECTFSSWRDSKIYTPGNIANSQTDRTPAKKTK